MLHRRQDLSTLAADLRAGEPAAFRTLVRDLTPPLLARALSIVKDFGAAQDVLQQAFLRIFVNRDRLPDTDPSIRGYCFRVLIHLAFDHLRNSRLRKLRETQAATSRTESIAAVTAPIDDDPERQAMANEAWELAMSLPEPIRDVLMLRFGLGLTIRETAEALALPVGTVSTRQRSGLEALREQIRQAALVPFAAGVTAAVGVDQVASLLVASSEKAANSFSAAVLRSIESAVLGKISGGVSTSTTALAVIVTAAALVVAIGLGTGHPPATPAQKFAPTRSAQHQSATAPRFATSRTPRSGYPPLTDSPAVPAPTAAVVPTTGGATGPATPIARTAANGRTDFGGHPATPTPPSTTDNTAPKPAEAAAAGVQGVVLDTANRPVAGVAVWPIVGGATAGTAADAVDFHSPDFAGASVTDFFGRFAIDGLNPAISYRLWVPESVEFLDAVRFAPSLRPGEIVDAGVIRLVRPGLLVGTVSDRTGTGVERATVHARPMKAAIDGGGGGDAGRAGAESGSAGMATDRQLGLPGSGAVSPLDPSVATDATGHFRFDRLRPGLYALTIFASGFRTAQIPAVRIREGEIAAPMAVTLTGGFELAVTVTNAHGHAVPNAVVRVSAGEFFGGGPTATGDEISVITDALGFARVENIPAPRIQLGVDARGYGRHAETIVLPANVPVSWHVTLRTGARLVGWAVDARNGHSIPNPQVIVTAADATGRQSTVGDTAGRFVLPDLPVGWCSIEIVAPNYAPLLIGPVMLGVGTTVELGSCQMTALTALTVAVVDAVNQPLSGASVTATPIGGGPAIAPTETDASGLGTLVSLVPGATIELTVRKAGFAAQTVSRMVPAEPPGTPPGVVVVVLLSNGATIHGTARRRFSGAVWPNAAVSLIQRDGTTADVRWADTAGQFVFAGVAPGEYALVAADEPMMGLKSKTQAPIHALSAGIQWVSVTAGEVVEAAVAWEMAGQTVHGRLLLDLGKPAAEWYVAVGEPSIGEKGAWILGRIIAETVTDADGWFELPDRYGRDPAPIIQAIGPDGSSAVFAWPTAVTAGGSHWNFVVASAVPEHFGEIHGTVVAAASGEPAVQVSVVAERIAVAPTSSLFRRETHTDKVGRFSLVDLPAGRYRITVFSPHFATCVIECAVAERTTIEPIIELRQGESVTLVAIASAGSSAMKVIGGPITVTLVGAHSFSVSRTTVFGQPITFTGLVVGETYTLTITAPGFRPHTEPLTIATARGLLEFTLRPEE